MTELQALRDDYDTAEAPEGIPGRFQLSPDVAVVPIRFIVTNPSNDPSFPVGWYSQDAANVIFDDTWMADIFVNSDPTLSPDNVVGKWVRRTGCADSSCKSPKPKQPDTIFEQCKVQFRIVDYKTCTVPPAAWISELNPPSDCSPDLQANKIQAELQKCLGTDAFNENVTNVVLTGLLTNPTSSCLNGDTLGAAKVTSKFVYITSNAMTGSGAEFVLSHELGHRLGLNHPAGSDVVCVPEQLMCPFADQMTDYIPPARCNLVHTKAQDLQDDFWQ